MPYDPALRYSDDECHAVFTELFPNGWAGADVVRELAPEGWECSPLVAAFHPSPERIYEETVRIHENMERFFASRTPAKDGSNDKSPAPKRSEPPTLEQVRAEHKPSTVEPERELRELVGMCLWDVFSDNHEVIGPDARIVDLGSFRASAGFLAEVINRQMGHAAGATEAHDLERLMQVAAAKSVQALLSSLEEDASRPSAHHPYGYMDYYMGTHMVSGRADLSPVYHLIFRRLKALGCDWQYHFPRLLLVDMRPLLSAIKKDEPEWTDYDPSTALAKEQEDQQRDAELAKMRADMDAAHREAVAAARDGPPPTTVAAYRDVFGGFPQGWPPEFEQ